MKINKAINFAINNIFKEGVTDIFPRPSEIDLLKNIKFRKIASNCVLKCIEGNSLDSLEINQINHVLLPKGGPFDFRRCALIQPLDTIKYLSLVLIFADELEKYRIKKNKKIVFSYRFKPNKDYLFDPKFNITTFKRNVANKVKQKSTKILVSCDIANFYDRLNLHRLESILLSLKFDKLRIKQLNELLFFWSNRDSYSLPVGSNASRILAEAALLEVDNYMLSVGIKFCRFVDDYRFFAPNVHAAHYWLTLFIERLWFEGLAINQRKTKIEDVSDKSKLESTGSQNIIKDTKKVFTFKTRIMAGYGGAVPTLFRAPSNNETSKLRKNDPTKLYSSIKSNEITEPDDVTLFIKSVVCTEKFYLLECLPELSDRFLQFTPYIVDVLIKYKDKIERSIKQKIRNKFSLKLRKERYLPEYLTMAIVRLLGCLDYQDKNTLLNYFRKLQRNAGSYIGRALLESLETLVSRNEVLEIRNYFVRADLWEKRQIVRIVDKHLNEEEKRPWLKNIRTQGSKDLFMSEYIKPSK